MLIASFPAGPWQANCYVVSPREEQSDAAEGSAPCVVVDPGMDAVDDLEQLLARESLVPQAVLLTHGHIDHVAGAAQFADAHGLPVHLHPADEHLLSDPAAGLSPESRVLVEQYFGAARLTPPADLHGLADGQRLSVAGLEFDLLHAPGHTAGCTLLRLADTPHGPVVFSGDVVFAGSIGRLDLPGGDPAAMTRTLREVVLTLDDATHLLPGHGGLTQVGHERRTNPYLTDAILDGGLS
ncbi:MBL fold metallo-hydrolase [Aestuariimicrobium ganziense]|uniref:MBL fold metallo-hydrolase n=1 Tax=Aestuariimicrobium ganziense TaxID=2773677 RepID=UPI0019411FF3|nr:MBL fold metallo-hydrolase [Aestuariimicrobium ganziense]